MTLFARKQKNFLILLSTTIGAVIITTALIKIFIFPAIVIPSLFPNNPIRPLAWITQKPATSLAEIPYGQSSLKADIYQPAQSFFTRKAVLLVHGANKLGKDDLRIQNLAETLSRTGVVVVAPTFPDITRESFAPEAKEQILAAFSWMQKQYPGYELGITGASVAAGPALLAAGDKRISKQVNILVIFGGYYDLKNVLKFALTGRYEHKGQMFYLQPEPFAKEFLSERYRHNFGLQSEFERLLSNADPEKFDELYGRLPEDIKSFAENLNPQSAIKNIRAKEIYLAHSIPDQLIPYTESLKLKDAFGEKTKLYEFKIFDHVTANPPKPNLKNLIFIYAPAVKNFYAIIFRILN